MLGVTVELKGLDQFIGAMELGPKEVKRSQRLAMGGAVRALKGEIVASVPRGPGHFGGHLGSRRGWAGKVIVLGEESEGHVKAALPQAKWLERGTRAHDIGPRRKRAVVVDGQPYAGVHHPGTKARPYIERATEKAVPAVEAKFTESLRRAMEKLGSGRVDASVS